MADLPVVAATDLINEKFLINLMGMFGFVDILDVLSIQNGAFPPYYAQVYFELK